MGHFADDVGRDLTISGFRRMRAIFINSTPLLIKRLTVDIFK